MNDAAGWWTLGRTFASFAGEVRWDVLGGAAAPPVVLVHGTPFPSVRRRGRAPRAGGCSGGAHRRAHPFPADAPRYPYRCMTRTACP
ncbi:hypothetical protein E6R18_15100 [Streptomyces sp. A1277]|nr:hypothetical protein E6R18_15100 [Streptomyces sp. A1277]